MKILSRLSLLLGGVLIFFAGSAFIFLNAHRQEAREMADQVEHEQADQLDRVLVLAGIPLRNFASDYSYWDDMVAYVGSRDPIWAAANIDASLQNLSAHAAWVLQPDGGLVHAGYRLDLPAGTPPPFLGPEFMARLQQQKFMHFFAPTAAGLLEVRTSPIQPSNDSARQTSPHGWFIVARAWDREFLSQLSQATHSGISLADEDSASAPMVGKIRVARALSDWRGQRVGTLYLKYNSAVLTNLVESYKTEVTLFCSLGASIIAVVIVCFSFWVVRPLHLLDHSLESGEVAPLAALRDDRSEFGHLARLVEKSFAQRLSLEREIAERQQVEAALRHSEESVHQAAELRLRLARDLHDHLIQSIYATGLGLECVRAGIRSDPAAAEQRLDAALASLNQAIREVRNFIEELEPEVSRNARFRQSVSALISALQTLQPVHFDLEIHEAAARWLNQNEELHALQIVRESVSNALRHGRAGRIQIKLIENAGRSELHIIDDGDGFDPAHGIGRGKGLTNVAARAREINAEIRLDTAAGKGTRLCLRFAQPTSL